MCASPRRLDHASCQMRAAKTPQKPPLVRPESPCSNIKAMRKQLTFLAIMVTAPLSTAVLLPACPAAADPPAKVCTDVRLGDADIDDAGLDELQLRAPAGMRAEQTITVDETCTARADPGRFAPVRSIPRRPRTSSEMYDCCGILMNAVYTSEIDGRVDVRTHANREPWNAGWAVAANSTAGVAHHVEFGYQGIFDPTGTWFYNVHDAEVTGGGCRLRITARHWFVGWKWVRGCG